MRSCRLERFVRSEQEPLWTEVLGRGPTLVLLHGGFQDARMWDAHMPLPSRSFRVIRYDLRFYGRSSRAGKAFSHVDDLQAILDAHGVERAALVGLSLGGRVAIDFCLAHPERVSALVLVASDVSGFEGESLPEPVRAEAHDAYLAGDYERMVDLALGTWGHLGVTEEMRQQGVANIDAVLGVEGAEPRALEPAYGRLGEISAPTLVIAASQDLPVMRDIAAELVSRIPSARRLDFDTDHFVPIRRPKEFSTAVAAFLGPLDD